MFNARSTNPTSGQVINDNIQKMLKTLSKVNIRYLLNGL